MFSGGGGERCCKKIGHFTRSLKKLSRWRQREETLGSSKSSRLGETTNFWSLFSDSDLAAGSFVFVFGFFES